MSETTSIKDDSIMLNNVRLSFPDLFQAVQYEGAGPFSYKASFLIVPGSDNDKKIRAAIERAGTAKWAAKASAIVKQAEAQGSGKFCYIDGNTKAYDGYEGTMALAASRPQDAGAPKIIDRDLSVTLTAADGRPYGGCYVNAKIAVWAQDNKFGKAIRATLIAVQFVKDGDSFGGTGPANADGFESVESDGDDLA